MDCERYFKHEIDFDELKDIVYRWGEDDPNIQSILFYAGQGSRPYIISVNFLQPSGINGLWGSCTIGITNWYSAQTELQKVMLTENCSPTWEKWLIFAHDISSNGFYLGEYLWQDGKRKDIEQENVQTELAGKAEMEECYGPVLESDSDTEPAGKDFVSDSWVLKESGFKKFLKSESPTILYQKKGALDIGSPDSKKEIEDIFPNHPLNKSMEKDPLFIAVKVREAFIKGDVFMVVPKSGRYNSNLKRLQKYVDDKYGRFLAKQKIKEIIALVNDGDGHGGKR